MHKITSYTHAVCRKQALWCGAAFLLVTPPCAASLRAAPTAATVLVGGRPLAFVASPYVNDKGQVVGPVDFVRAIGGGYTPHPETQTVSITNATGKSLNIPYTLNQQRCFVPLQSVATALGAITDWQPAKRTLVIKSRLEAVKQDGSVLSITASYPVSYRVGRINNPSRIYIDLYGTNLAAKPATFPSSTNGNILRVRTGQMPEDTVRVVVDLKQDVPFKVASAASADHISISFSDPAPSPNPAAATPAQPVVSAQRTISLAPLLASRGMTVPRANSLSANPAAKAAVETPASGASGFVRILGVSFKKVSDTLSQVEIKASGPAKYRTVVLADPMRLAFDLEGADLDDSVQRDLPVDDPAVKAIRAGILQGAPGHYGRIVLDLSRMVGYKVEETPGEAGPVYLVSLNESPSETPGETPAAPPGDTPPAPPGDTPNGPPAVTPKSPIVTPSRPTLSLAGKVVVVDPGHGAEDTGAIGIGGVYEKDLTLAIGRKLRDALVEAGATVYMTRNEDIKPSVSERPRIAIAYGADFFISVHCDESGSRNSHSGTTVYYHAHNPICRHFASCISGRVGQVSGIPALGVKSDTIRFQTGFGVLRGSPMPAVLVECGYMNSEADLSRLTVADTQQHIAEGIVDGLRDFISAGAAGH